MQVPPGAGVPPPHSHVEHEELVYVLDGTLRYTVGGVTRDLGPGDTMGTPRGVPHAFANPHAAPARVLVMNSPASTRSTSATWPRSPMPAARPTGRGWRARCSVTGSRR